MAAMPTWMDLVLVHVLAVSMQMKIFTFATLLALVAISEIPPTTTVLFSVLLATLEISLEVISAGPHAQMQLNLETPSAEYVWSRPAAQLPISTQTTTLVNV